MAETRYFTLNHEPPNGGVPPGTMFAQATQPADTHPTNNAPPDYGPPNGGNPNNGSSTGISPPPYNSPVMGYPIPGFVVLPTSPPPASPPVPPPMPPPVTRPQGAPFQGFPGPVYEPPGQYVDGQIMQGADWSYISHPEHVTIHFVNGGVRPSDSPNGYHPHEFGWLKHKVPCNLTVRELIQRLGCPPGPTKGVTEMMIEANDRFLAGDTFTQGGETSRRTLAEVGWNAARGDGNPVWLMVKR